jgi:hypothetical protein
MRAWAAVSVRPWCWVQAQQYHAPAFLEASSEPFVKPPDAEFLVGAIRGGLRLLHSQEFGDWRNGYGAINAPGANRQDQGFVWSQNRASVSRTVP